MMGSLFIAGFKVGSTTSQSVGAPPTTTISSAPGPQPSTPGALSGGIAAASENSSASMGEEAIHKASLQKMTEILLHFGTAEKNLDELMTELKNHNQDPVLVRDANPYTGEMILVRTQSPFAGTRYFHAQYFRDDNNQTFPQHMSFEFRPGPEAMKQALKAVRAAFPNLEKPTHENADFIQWNLGDRHVLWMKRLDLQDISENPFNAYTEADIGSIRVAVELALEGH